VYPLIKLTDLMGIFTSKIEITTNTRIQRKDNLLFNHIDGEVVMLSVENSEYYGMDKVGSRIWELLEHPIVFKDLVIKLMDEYNVSEQQCYHETLDFINKLCDKNMVICV
jgi:hypothetical protein